MLCTQVLVVSSCCIDAITSSLAVISVSLRILGSKASVLVVIGDVLFLSDSSGCTDASVSSANRAAGSSMIVGGNFLEA